MKYHALFVIFHKAANLKLMSAANYVALYGLTQYHSSGAYRVLAWLTDSCVSCSVHLFVVKEDEEA